MSERAFEDYLATRGLVARYEELPPGITKPADYSLELGGRTTRFEIKEWEPQQPTLGLGHHDPYGPIRDKIQEGRLKFKPYKGRGEPCVLVLCHYGPQLIMLDAFAVLGAMRGDVGWVFPIDTSTGIGDGDRTEMAFLKGGGMIHHAPNGAVRTQNTTISAIAVLGSIDIRSRMMDLEFRRRERATGRMLSIDEAWELADQLSEADQPPHVELRLAVYDNLEAEVPLPRGFPAGPYDERVGLDGNFLRRIYVGDALRNIEREQEALGIQPDDPLGLRRG